MKLTLRNLRTFGAMAGIAVSVLALYAGVFTLYAGHVTLDLINWMRGS